MKAVILCGGLGTRLRILTKNCPKPLLKFQNLSITEWQILRLKDVGVDEILINLFYLGDQIKNYLGNGDRFSVKIRYMYQKKLNGTAGAVKIFENELKNEKNFFVLYGDILTNENFSDLILYHNKTKADCSIYVHQNKKSNSLLYLDKMSGLVLDLTERPNLKEKQIFTNKYKLNKFFSNSGVYLMNRNVLNDIPLRNNVDFPKDVFPILIDKKKLYALEVKKQRFAVDTLEKYEFAQKHFKPYNL